MFQVSDHLVIVKTHPWQGGIILFGITSYMLGANFLMAVESEAWFHVSTLSVFFMVPLAMIGFHQSARFDRNIGRFEYEAWFFLPFKQVHGRLGEIDYVEMKTPPNGRTTLAVFHSGKTLLLYGIKSPSPDMARRLAVLIGCKLRFTGNNSRWPELNQRKEHEETLEQVTAKVNDIQNARDGGNESRQGPGPK